MQRRHWLYTGAGALAAAAGIGWQLRRGALAPGPDDLPPGFWDLRFARPEGGELALAEFRGRPLVLNFWATWCPPCIKEMPDLDRFQRDFASRGWRVVGLAVDGPTPVRQFLQKTPVSFAIGLAGFDGTELSRALGNTTGALPFTAVIGAGGRIVQRKLGQTPPEELQRWGETLR